jgi:hypothetical protein
MNTVRYETQLHRDADRLHELAQQNGDRAAYIRAAELYELCGDYRQARICRECAERLAR